MLFRSVSRRITSNGGSAYTNKKFKDLAALIEVKHKVTILYAPEGHAPVERMIQQYRVGFHATLIKTQSWVDHVGGVSFGINNAKNCITGVEPAKTVFGTLSRLAVRADTEVAFAIVPDEETPQSHIAEVIEIQWTMVSHVLEAIQVEHERQQQEQWQAARGQTKYTEDDKVIIKDLNPTKEGAPWIGSYVMKADISNGQYRIAPLCRPESEAFNVNTKDIHPFYHGCLKDS